jgi:hypothetical protein
MSECTCYMGFGTNDGHRMSCPASIEYRFDEMFEDNVRLRKLLSSIGDLPRHTLDGKRALYGGTMKDAVTGEVSELYVKYKDIANIMLMVEV